MHHRFIDQHSGLDSRLHRMDPRMKIVMFSGIVLFVLMAPPKNPEVLFFYGAVVLGLVKLSCVPLCFVFLRSLAILPFALFAAFSLLLPATPERFVLFGMLVVKAYLSIVSMTLLISTTKFADLLKALEKMRCPFLFVMILSFMYRYLYLIIDEFMRLNQARESRCAVKTRNTGLKLKAMSSMAGTLLIRSFERGESVHMAMCSRGYTGEIRTLGALVIAKSDCVFLFVVFVFLAGVRILCAYYV